MSSGAEKAGAVFRVGFLRACLYIHARDARCDEAGDLVVDRVEPVGDSIDGQSRRAEERDFRALFDTFDVRDVDHALIHADASDDGRRPSRDFDVRLARKGADVAVGVAAG